jgi:hypothetical protein
MPEIKVAITGSSMNTDLVVYLVGLPHNCWYLTDKQTVQGTPKATVL